MFCIIKQEKYLGNSSCYKCPVYLWFYNKFWVDFTAGTRQPCFPLLCSHQPHPIFLQRRSGMIKYWLRKDTAGELGKINIFKHLFEFIFSKFQRKTSQIILALNIFWKEEPSAVAKMFTVLRVTFEIHFTLVAGPKNLLE